MKLSEFKESLKTMDGVKFYDTSKKPIPPHFHITEVGMTNRSFIDCGGTLRDEKLVSFQLWHSHDYHHRLNANKIEKIIAIAEERLGLEDGEIEIEYQGDTIGKYSLKPEQSGFYLQNKHTDCLAKDSCDIPDKPRIKIGDLSGPENLCVPGSGCC